MHLLADIGTGSQARIGTNQGSGPHLGPLQMTKGPDHCPGIDADARRKDHELLHQHPRRDLGIPREMHRVGGQHGDPFGQKMCASPGLKNRLGLSQLGWRIGPHHRALWREVGPHHLFLSGG